MNVGRNDPCPCGSGNKYKKCCFLKDETARAERAAAAATEAAATEAKAPVDATKATTSHRTPVAGAPQRPKSSQAKKPVPIRRRAV